MEVEGFEPPQEEEILIRRSERSRRVPNCLCLNVEAEEHSLGDLNEPTSYKDAMLDSESNKWINAMNAKIQSMIDNMVWVLVDLPPGCKTVRRTKSCTCRQLSHDDYLLSSKTISSRSTALMMVAAAQNTNNSTIRSEGKLAHLEQPLIPLPYPVASQATHDAFEALCDAQNEEDGQSVSSYLLKMKSYLDILERLGYAMPNELGGKIQKDKKKPRGAKGKDKGKTKLAFAPKPKIQPPPKRYNPTKDSVYYHCPEVVHWRRRCPSYHAELKKRKSASITSTSGSRWLKHGALSLYMGNEMHGAVEAIGSFDLVLASGLIIVFQNEVENQLGKKIKAIGFDQGGEYLSYEFVNHMKSHGIVSQLTLPYTPQHIGVPKRSNQTLLDMVRSMMNLTTLPKYFWGYALESAARILNMVPTKKVERMPYEIWHGKLPSYPT
ncbi:retrotransposon protein, putative, ty1-copia subclass [Tanacetum coccineum]|uniref:Retrotransposon protein, putative, ty1-copia subclass n=1 Tax=Tanacetum coccineum TaxID=301880 RepID=A0ABQ5CVF2_9ASTR